MESERANPAQVWDEIMRTAREAGADPALLDLLLYMRAHQLRGGAGGRAPGPLDPGLGRHDDPELFGQPAPPLPLPRAPPFTPGRNSRSE